MLLAGAMVINSNNQIKTDNYDNASWIMKWPIFTVQNMPLFDKQNMPNSDIIWPKLKEEK